MHPDIAGLASVQGGAVTRGQILRHHHSAWIRHAVQVGALQRFAPGVFVLASAGSSIGDRIRRTEIALGVPLVACGPTAAELHGVSSPLAPTGLLHVTTDSGRSMRAPRGVRLRQMTPRSDPVVVDGVRVVPLADTAIDLATSARSLDRLAILDAVATLVSLDEIRAAVERAHGRRGLDDVRRLAIHADGRAESAMESRTRQRIIQRGLPTPEVQLDIHFPDGTTHRPDLSYLHRRIGIEYDGEDFHTGTGSLRRDRQRHNRFTAHNWTMIYLTADDVYVRPDRFLGLLEELLLRPARPASA